MSVSQINEISPLLNIDCINLVNLIQNSNTLIIVSWSPTGNGHMDRLLGVLKTSISEGYIKKSDIILIHLPSKWKADKNAVPSIGLDEFTKKMSQEDITILFTKSNDTGIHGDYSESSKCNKDVNTTRNFRINKYFVEHLLEDDEIMTWAGINENGIRVYNSNNILKTDLPRKFFYQNEHSNTYNVDSDQLIKTITTIKNPSKIKILTDMQPKLQKAAKKYNILDSNRIDQQNHGTILISDDNLRMDSNFIPSSEFAYISKAVGGYGEMVYQIKINGDPSIVILEKTEKCFSIFHDSNNMEDIFKSGVNYFLNYGKKLYYNDNCSKGGIITKDNSKLTNIKSIIYIYLNGSSLKKIIESIYDNWNEEILFVICGSETINTPNIDDILKLDPLALCYTLSMTGKVHGITAGGAGVLGEFNFFNNTLNGKALSLIIPFEEQYEQKKNSIFIQNLIPNKIWICSEQEIERKFQYFLKNVREYNVQNDFSGYKIFKKQLINLLNNNVTQQKKTSDLLFGKETISHNVYSFLECKYKNDLKLKFKRRLIKFFLQFLLQLDSYQNEIKLFECSIKFKRNGIKHFINWNFIKEIINNDNMDLEKFVIFILQEKIRKDELNNFINDLEEDESIKKDLSIIKELLYLHEHNNINSENIKFILEQIGENIYHGY